MKLSVNSAKFGVKNLKPLVKFLSFVVVNEPPGSLIELLRPSHKQPIGVVFLHQNFNPRFCEIWGGGLSPPLAKWLCGP